MKDFTRKKEIMKLKTKKVVIRTISIIVTLISLATAYLFASGIIEYEPMQIEGAPTISLNAQIILLSILAVINLINLILCKNLMKHKKLLITLNIIQLLFGGIAHIVGSITMLIILFIDTTDVQEEKKPLELPTLEKIYAKHKWVYLVIWLIIFTVFYSGIVPMAFLQKLPPVAIMIIVYLVQALILVPMLWKDIKRDFTEFRKNYKTYMRYILPKIGIFIVVYIIITIPIALIVGAESTNQSAIKELPLAFTVIMAVFFAPFIEEFLFRGLLRKGITNDKIFIICSSLIFGATHVLYAEENLLMYLYIIPYALIGYFLSRTYTKTNNIFTNVTVHFLWNAFCMTLTVITSLIG